MKTTHADTKPLGTAGFVLSVTGLTVFAVVAFYCHVGFQREIQPNAIEGNFLPPGSFKLMHYQIKRNGINITGSLESTMLTIILTTST